MPIQEQIVYGSSTSGQHSTGENFRESAKEPVAHEIETDEFALFCAMNAQRHPRFVNPCVQQFFGRSLQNELFNRKGPDLERRVVIEEPSARAVKLLWLQRGELNVYQVYIAAVTGGKHDLLAERKDEECRGVIQKRAREG
jgi:hypothetical protein